MDEKNFTFEFDKSKKVMEELLYTAEPIKSYCTLITLIGVLIGLVVFLFLVESKKIKSITGTYRQIATLLSGLIALIIFATTLFTAWNLYTIQPVKLYETYMESFHGKTSYKQIKRAGIYNDKQQSFINAQVTIREDNLLAIEKKDKRVMLFAEENYDLRELVKRIQTQMKK